MRASSEVHITVVEPQLRFNQSSALDRERDEALYRPKAVNLCIKLKLVWPI